MKNTIKGFAAGFLACLMLSGTLVWANTRTIEISHAVSVVAFGVRQHFADDMRPFISEGRTFLPVRPVADMLGVTVDWDGATSTVFLGNRPLDSMAPANIVSSREGGEIAHRFNRTENTLTGQQGNTFSRGVIFEIDGFGLGPGRIPSDAAGAQMRVTYNLGGQYGTLTGTVIRPVSHGGQTLTHRQTPSTEILFHGDGRLLYRTQNIGVAESHEFTVDVSGVGSLVISVVCNGGNNAKSYTALAGAALYR